MGGGSATMGETPVAQAQPESAQFPDLLGPIGARRSRLTRNGFEACSQNADERP